MDTLIVSILLPTTLSQLRRQGRYWWRSRRLRRRSRNNRRGSNWKQRYACTRHSFVPVAVYCTVSYHIYSGKFSLGAIFAIFMDRPASANIKAAIKWTKMEINDIITCVHRVPMWARWLSTVCLSSSLNGCYKEESASYCTKYYKLVRNGPKMSHQPVGVWSECPAFRKITAAKFSSKQSGRFSVKICTSENFPLLYGTFTWEIVFANFTFLRQFTKLLPT